MHVVVLIVDVDGVVGVGGVFFADTRRMDGMQIGCFGKHRAHTVADLEANEPGYVSWALRQAAPRKGCSRLWNATRSKLTRALTRAGSENTLNCVETLGNRFRFPAWCKSTLGISAWYCLMRIRILEWSGGIGGDIRVGKLNVADC